MEFRAGGSNEAKSTRSKRPAGSNDAESVGDFLNAP
jgi:hypothetical protein